MNACPHDSVVPTRVYPGIPNPDKIYDAIAIGAGMSGTSAIRDFIDVFHSNGILPDTAIIDRSPDLSLTQGASRRSAGKFVSLYNKPPEELDEDIARDFIALGEGEKISAQRAQDTVIEILNQMRLGCARFELREAKFPIGEKSLKKGLLVVDCYRDADQLRQQIKERSIYGLPTTFDMLNAEGVAYELGSDISEYQGGYVDMLGGSFHPGTYISNLHDGLHDDGTDFFLDSRVISHRREDGLHVVECSNGTKFRTKTLVSASVHDPAISTYLYERTLPFYAHAVSAYVGDYPHILRNISAFYNTNRLADYGHRDEDFLWYGRSDSIESSRRIDHKRAGKHIRAINRVFSTGIVREDITHWNGVYYQTPNELPVLVNEGDSFYALGGLGGYGNTLGQRLGGLVGASLACQLLSISIPEVESGINFFLNLPHVETFSENRAAAAQRLLKEWIDTDNECNHPGIKARKRALKVAKKIIRTPRRSQQRLPPRQRYQRPSYAW